MSNSPTLILCAHTPARLHAANAARVLLTLPWAKGPLPRDPWLAHLLPRHDYNTALLDRLDAAPLPRGAFVGLFLADPWFDPDTALPRLAALGAGGVAAFPGLSRLGGGFADDLAQARLTPAREAAGLARARAAGFATLAALWHGAPDWPADTAPPDHVLAPPGAPTLAGARATWRYEAPCGAARDVLRLARAG